MKFHDFYGQSSVTGELEVSFGQGRVVHGFLFTGPEGCGKRTLARICAQALLCTGKNKPCDVCSACKRFMAGVHPDAIELDTQKTAIGVDDIRALIAAVSEKPFEGGNRAILIFKAMTPQAQNAFLKTLEEPPWGTAFFLAAKSPSELLPTVVSRLRVIALGALDEQTCARALAAKGIEPQRARLLARLSGGIVGKALAMREDTRYWQIREKAYAFFKPAAPSEAPALIAEYSQLRAEGREFLACVESVLLDIIRFHAGAACIATDKLAQTEEIARCIGVRQACDLMDVSIGAAARLSGNVSWQAVMEALVFKLVEGTKGWQM